MEKFDWQAVLWAAPETWGGWWTWGWGTMALLAALLMFLRTVWRERWTLLTAFRALYTFGLFTIFLAALNSGWQRWTEPLFAISGLGMAIIYFLNWHREPSITKRLREKTIEWADRPFVVAAKRNLHR